MNRERFEELLDAWALGELSPEDQRAFDEALEAQPDWMPEAKLERAFAESLSPTFAPKAPTGLLDAVLKKAESGEDFVDAFEEPEAKVIDVAAPPAPSEKKSKPLIPIIGIAAAAAIAAGVVGVVVIGGGEDDLAVADAPSSWSPDAVVEREAPTRLAPDPVRQELDESAYYSQTLNAAAPPPVASSAAGSLQISERVADQVIPVEYDPTNGTISPGDVWRIKDDAIVPSAFAASIPTETNFDVLFSLEDDQGPIVLAMVVDEALDWGASLVPTAGFDPSNPNTPAMSPFSSATDAEPFGAPPLLRTRSTDLLAGDSAKSERRADTPEIKEVEAPRYTLPIVLQFESKESFEAFLNDEELVAAKALRSMIDSEEFKVEVVETPDVESISVTIAKAEPTEPQE